MKNGESRMGLGQFDLLDALTVAFVVLKLIGKIDWSWWWVLSPVWGALLFGLLVLVGGSKGGK